MFYLFHHIPKCGGTSFNQFLKSIFNVTPDRPIGWKGNPEKLDNFCANPIDLHKLSARDCVTGHYNLPRIRLWTRYPELESIEHRKFSVIRDPADAAISGAFFNAKRGKIPHDKIQKHALARVGFIPATLGIKSEADIDAVLDRYWFMAPLQHIDVAAGLLENATGRKGAEVGQINTTSKPVSMDFLDNIREEFEKRAVLDYAIYRRACKRFEEFTLKDS